MQLITVGEIVRTLRSRLNLEQVELARTCGWRDASAVSRIETDRIQPTRRTLAKLARSLARDGMNGSEREVEAWLFLAAGIPPTADDVDVVTPLLPAIETWGQPALITDFTWAVWAANDLFTMAVGLPPNFRGRNYLGMMFEADGSIRRTLGTRWVSAAATTVADFRQETDDRAGQRWHRRLLEDLRRLPDFGPIFDGVPPAERRAIPNRLRAILEEGTVALARYPISADPRLRVIHIVPEDARMAREMMRRGLLLA